MTIDVQEVEVEEVLVEVAEEVLVEVAEEEVEEDQKCIRQLALIAVKNVKFHLGHLPENQFTAMIVLKEMEILDQAGPIDLEGEISEDPVLKTGKCIKQLVLNAAIDVKSPSGPQAINLFTAVIALAEVKAGIPDQKNLTNPRNSMNS